MAKDKNSFVLYANYIDIINALSNEQAGILIKHIYAYVNDLNPDDPTDPVIKIAWLSIKSSLKADLKKWEEERQKRSEAGKKGMESRYNKSNKNVTNDNNVNECYNKTNNVKNDITNLTDIVIDNVIDIVNVNDIDIDNIDNKITIEDNIEREDSACTHDYIFELISIIKDKIPEIEESNLKSFKSFFENLSKNYSQKNISTSTYHALSKLLEKYDEIENPYGYLWSSIAINCETFKHEG